MQGGGRPTSGVLPNIHVRGISMDTVRTHPEFAALPPVDQLVLGSLQCYRCSLFARGHLLLCLAHVSTE